MVWTGSFQQHVGWFVPACHGAVTAFVLFHNRSFHSGLGLDVVHAWPGTHVARETRKLGHPCCARKVTIIAQLIPLRSITEVTVSLPIFYNFQPLGMSERIQILIFLAQA